ncbi:Nickel-binding protein NikA [Austwickia sp. TVS 96-490-7B]|uniref:ABC transporter substrate-binding protein n=1 Tax=Austwickia sp. TVS 96-490-7B TaxID=2830843 RepID=UPI001C59AA6E|nr:ABC transporter substrate-binding protein [Austwickia sp. TVS 96-490-7B]MBW3084256.1 Nickel-binding protein NikA [Austwickia sp. TVS 96-490-7B]
MNHHPRRRTTALAVTTTVLGSALLTGCMATAPTDSPSGSGRLRLALNFTPIADLSPYTEDAVSLTRMGVAEALVSIDKDGSPRPGLAEKFEMTDSKTATFTLRRDVTFHDGTALDAKAVTDSLNHALKATPAPATLSGRALTVTAKDDHTVTVTSDKDDPILVQRFANPDTVILAAKAYTKNPNKPDPTNAGTGPFRLTTLTGTTAATADAYPTYWGGKPHLTGLDVTFVSKADSRVSALRSGEVDVIQNVPIAQVANITDHVVDKRAIPRTTGISLNTKNGPFTDTGLRVAAAKAISGTAVATTVFEGKADPAAGYFRGDTTWTDHRPAPTYPDPSDPHGKTITIATYDDRPELPETATLVADQLRKAGFTVNPPVVKKYSLIEKEFTEGTYDAVIASRMYASKAGDPIAILQSDFGCKGGYNLAFFCDKETDEILDKAATSTDLDERRRAAITAETRILSQAPYLPLVHEQVRIGHAKTVTGLADDPLEWRMITKDTVLAK